jgi:hypothetical protein
VLELGGTKHTLASPALRQLVAQAASA